MNNQLSGCCIKYAYLIKSQRNVVTTFSGNIQDDTEISEASGLLDSTTSRRSYEAAGYLVSQSCEAAELRRRTLSSVAAGYQNSKC